MIQRPPACRRHAESLLGKAKLVDPAECPWCWAEERERQQTGASDVDTPEGSVWRKVRMSDTLFRVLGAGGVEWGEPDEEGFYTPTVYLGPDGKMDAVRLVVERDGRLIIDTEDSGEARE